MTCATSKTNGSGLVSNVHFYCVSLRGKKFFPFPPHSQCFDAGQKDKLTPNERTNVGWWVSWMCSPFWFLPFSPMIFLLSFCSYENGLFWVLPLTIFLVYYAWVLISSCETQPAFSRTRRPNPARKPWNDGMWWPKLIVRWKLCRGRKFSSSGSFIFLFFGLDGSLCVTCSLKGLSARWAKRVWVHLFVFT